MVRTKIDSRIKTFIEDGVKLQHRTMFVIVGDKGRDQVVVLHHILTKSVVKARPSVLWCYKNDLGFSINTKKKMKLVKKKTKAGRVNINEEDPFELFIASTDIKFRYYKQTQEILGRTFGVCVLQDFEALEPNILARTIETVEGGGLVILLLRSMTSLRQLYNMTMDVHERYRTEAHKDIVGRFNERFILSLSSCERCLVVDSSLNVLPLSSHIFNVNPVCVENKSETNSELKNLVDNLRDTQPIGSIVSCCKTLDQAKAVLKFIDAISEKTLRYTVSLTASRGRGKSAALGLAVSAAVAFGYTNIFVTSPSPDNLKTFFEFVCKGFDALGYQEHLDYGLVKSTNDKSDEALIRVNIFKTNRQTIQYIHPTDANKLSHAELLVIDEAAAIPLPLVKKMLGPYLVFLSSTINGYEGTGRSLSLKLLQELRTQSNSNSNSDLTKSSNRTLYEITLEESIRYKTGDPVEEWLTNLLCLNACNIQSSVGGIPSPSECDLYYINRDTLFSYHKASEMFLQKLVALYVSSHYKNSPNDLQLLSDAPAHHIFCLLGPVDKNMKILPDILCVLQVCFEGRLTSSFVNETFSAGRKPTGDLIPWTIGQQFLDRNFPSLPGLRVVRIATHPDYQSMGYGSRALSLLLDYYNLELYSLSENTESGLDQNTLSGDSGEGLIHESIEPRSNLPPLLMKLNERPPERIQYIGVSYGLTSDLLRFWKKSGFVPLYVRQTPNKLTGEHSCVMIRVLNKEDCSWLLEYWTDFRRRFSSLLSFQFREMQTSLGLSVLNNKNIKGTTEPLTKQFLDCHLTNYDLKRLEMYCNNLVDYHSIMDLLPTLSKLYFFGMFSDLKCSAIQSAILLGIGLQHKTIDELSKDLELPTSQLFGIFNRSMRKIQQFLANLTEEAVEETLGLKNLTSVDHENGVENRIGGLKAEMDADDKSLRKKQRKELDSLKREFLQEYAIQGTDEEWNKALSEGPGKTLSIKKSAQVMSANNKVWDEPKKLIPFKKRKTHKK
ncbi:unnamed protein product [Nezara viridula]|uniref:RNA cytidine acetyltransferase n=1 Tax=Nezara viridula TaxID=85310 RepID=A0A9P0GZG0_NEZVI|nr:unnamed protein product [Nezara viridula]